jgi:hypothetical protein
VIVQGREALGPVGTQHRLRAEVDCRVEELLDEAAQDLGIDQRRKLVAEFELLQNLDDVRGEAVQECLEVGLELLRPAASLEIPKRERRRVVEGLTCGLA